MGTIEQREYRNMTVSTKLTPAEKIELASIADRYKITPSELYYSLIISFKDHYEYIGRETPIEQKLKEQLQKEEKHVKLLKVKLENSKYHLETERKRAVEIYNDRDEYHHLTKVLTKENKMLKTINESMSFRLKTIKNKENYY
jgi:predicted RNase H-like nuclease (RuvC/YqgF family)